MDSQEISRIVSKVPKASFLELGQRVRLGPICRTGVPRACDWYPQVGLVYVLGLWFLHKTS